ncbi:phosphate ABC transporter permease subunit PstC [Mesobaculum littorinae]|uniref:Phosphate transport system permease protein n=1 Tax=Mesobaculum littorinae TaxID=2486419 RepID=A0A438AM23_9RHOB|nr:phosphate ABC transporter permease subunit PstC [Mesobaculum littorinae]RVV99645.1 phosphate ABC transporter permease subunit PstC [Mesobaculum littorinae]
MSLIWLFAILLALAVAGYWMTRRRAMTSAGGDVRKLHSLPNYYGMNAAMLSLAPALIVLFVWLLAQPLLVDATVTRMIPDEAIPDASNRGLVMSDVRRVSNGLDALVDAGRMSAQEARDLSTDSDDIRASMAEVGVALGSDVRPEVLRAAQRYRLLTGRGDLARNVIVVLIALAGAGLAYRRTTHEFRARNAVERGMSLLLLGAASIAILTTIGIVLSMLTETGRFFSQYPWTEFFFSTNWQPRFGGGSDLGFLPLLWGTLYISIIALIVAVPVGLFSAIYLSEYATGRIRAVAKPMIEILAGIPTIVYGLFALITVGPLLRDWFAQPLGLGNSGSSVMTAGLVMGIMLIPFVSSLSDDIINAVPQSLRDGSFGLGATKSETIRQVILPAALPGIVGAVLLAASRAIGETMIVVLGAGASARMDLNPFEAMTTITVKIVSQLTGDTDFNSPETLVAFALGLTLFVLTLGLNVFALYIVRRYREQYE